MSDAYLQRSGPAPGYSIVVFRARHAAEPTDLTIAELTAFWSEVRAAAKVIQAVFEPCQLNYQLLGNAVPHVHVHIVPRYLDDPAPERPLPWNLEPSPDVEFDAHVNALRAARRQGGPVFPLTHNGLCGDMFVVRDGRFLVLTRAGLLGEGVEYIPGGLVDPGEDPMDGAIRETKEESGLDVRDVSLLRIWTYTVPEGWETTHATYVGFSDVGDVVLTPEHSAHRWVTVDEYIENSLAANHGTRIPQFDAWFGQVRKNCELVRTFLKRT